MAGWEAVLAGLAGGAERFYGQRQEQENQLKQLLFQVQLKKLIEQQQIQQEMPGRRALLGKMFPGMEAPETESIAGLPDIFKEMTGAYAKSQFPQQYSFSPEMMAQFGLGGLAQQQTQGGKKLKVGDKTYNIPLNNLYEFMKDNPEAVEVR